MEDTKKLAVVKNDELGNSRFVIDIKYDVMTMTVLSGHDPLIEEVYAAIFSIMTAEAPLGAKLYNREDNFRFCYRSGMSGCMDYFVETAEYATAVSFPKRKHLFHRSMYGKVPQIKSAFIYDVLDLGVALGLVTIVDGKYALSNKLTSTIEKASIVLLDPRDLNREDGWNEYRLVDVRDVAYI